MDVQREMIPPALLIDLCNHFIGTARGQKELTVYGRGGIKDKRCLFLASAICSITTPPRFYGKKERQRTSKSCIIEELLLVPCVLGW